MLKQFDIFDQVRVVDGDNRPIKEGIIVRMTNAGAQVYQPKSEYPFTDNMEFAEWFPFTSKERKIVLLKKHESKKV